MWLGLGLIDVLFSPVKPLSINLKSDIKADSKIDYFKVLG